MMIITISVHKNGLFKPTNESLLTHTHTNKNHDFVMAITAGWWWMWLLYNSFQNNNNNNNNNDSSSVSVNNFRVKGFVFLVERKKEYFWVFFLKPNCSICLTIEIQLHALNYWGFFVFPNI